MAKRTGSEDREQKLRRKLAKAQLALQEAQEKRGQALSKGEQLVEKARRRADTQVAKATKRVERRASEASRLESRLLELQSSTRAASTPSSAVHPEEGQASLDGQPGQEIEMPALVPNGELGETAVGQLSTEEPDSEA